MIPYGTALPRSKQTYEWHDHVIKLQTKKKLGNWTSVQQVAKVMKNFSAGCQEHMYTPYLILKLEKKNTEMA